ncbi:hypothetical protein HPP92_020397 [Vanilla planifolia]|uniref:Uncharacterized protein n=1 Tax=Vanilla planifolia TaxID=51239 RepID=A0A835UJR1_VANPL|nr:hypothetical protein HPP92_020785 [Vanilla planifolia]KAG0461921.1 hypothetical protein HPP92_020397 [Vanilla planifolia]
MATVRFAASSVSPKARSLSAAEPIHGPIEEKSWPALLSGILLVRHSGGSLSCFIGGSLIEGKAKGQRGGGQRPLPASG